MSRGGLDWGATELSFIKEVFMKKFLIVSLAVLFTAALMPQSGAAAVGVKGGLALSNLSMSEAPDFPLKSLKFPVAGVFYGFNLGLFTIQPEALYVRMGTRIEADASNWVEERIETIQVPVLLKINVIPGPISPMIYAGPYAAFRLSAKEIITDNGVSTTYDIKEDTKSSDFGVVFGGGIELKLVAVKLSAEVRYNLGLANVAVDPAPGFSVKNKILMVLVGIGF
jgi:hypothetical protein